MHQHIARSRRCSSRDSGHASRGEKIHNLFEDLKKTLNAAGAQVEEVVEIDTYHSAVKDTAAFDAEFRQFLGVYDGCLHAARLQPLSPASMRVPRRGSVAVAGAACAVGRVARPSGRKKARNVSKAAFRAVRLDLCVEAIDRRLTCKQCLA